MIKPRHMSSEWIDWHAGYADGSPLSARLRVVQEFITRALDDAPPGPIPVVSICAGDGRDLLGVVTEHPRGAEVRARLVELDPQLAAAGRERAQRQSPGHIDVVTGDAATTDAYAGAVPAWLVLVCGVFGNITDDDVRRTIDNLSGLCAERAWVVWTRGRFEPDLTPTIRSWFADAGYDELGFTAIPDTLVAVGAQRLTASPAPFRAGTRLFTFLPRNQRPSQAARRAPR